MGQNEPLYMQIMDSLVNEVAKALFIGCGTASLRPARALAVATQRRTDFADLTAPAIRPDWRRF